jgi:hypothetical protein
MEDEDIAQKLFLDSDSKDELTSQDSDSDSDSNQDKTRQNDKQQTDNTQSQCGAPVIHRFTGDPSGTCHSQAPPVNKDLTPLSAFLCGYYPAAGGRD